MKYAICLLALIATGCGTESVVSYGYPVVGPTGPAGERGADGATGPQGPKGDTGEQGIQGEKGDKGDSCTVLQAVNGAVISCQDGTSVLVLNGQDGANGRDGVDGQDGRDGQDGAQGPAGPQGPQGPAGTSSPYAITSIIDPCGDMPGQFDEILIRLADNSLIAYFEDGGRRFLSLLPPGNYVTTDRQACRFTVNPDMTVTF